jgi:hypothetical protein
MSSLNGVTYICSAGLSSVTSAGSLGPYFALTYFLPMYDFRIDKTICDTSALSISSLNYSSATHNSLSALEKIYNNPELSGQGSYNIANFNSLYLRDVTGGGPLFTNTRQRNADNKVNILNGKVLQNQVSAVGFSNTANGSLSATGSYTTLNGTSVNSWNPLSGTTANWNYKNLFRVTSYSPNQSTSGTASGNYKCRIPAGTGSFKFNMLAIYATRVNQFGYADPGVVGSPYNPTLFAIVVFDTPQVKSDTAGSLNAFEANVELNFALQSAQAQAIYVNTDYFTRVPTSNTTSAYALNYDGDVVISSSASPGSWVPRAKLTITDPEKDQVRLAYDDSRFTNIKTQSFKPYPTYPPTAAMAVLNIDTSCPDDSLLQLGYNCAATGIKSVAIGCYSSALGYEDSGSPNFGQINPDFDYIYQSNRGGYTLAIGVETLSQGLVSTSLGYQTSSIGFASFAGGFGSIASSQDMYTMYYGNPSEGMNFAYGFKTSAITDSNSIFPGNGSPSSISNWFTGIVGNLAGGNFAANIQTLAKGNGNVALGIDTVAYGTGNTSLGMATSAMNILSIATGLSTISNGILAQSHGQYTSANAILSYVYGGLALADVNAHGSFTFGSPYIYGSGGGNTTLYVPGYTVRTWNGTAENPPTMVSESSYVVDKYVSTYNDAMASFVYGQGSSAFTEALHSFVAGPMNQTKSQASFIFGYLNIINTNSGFNSVIGSNNNLVSSKYTHIKGSHNTLTGSDYSFVTGIKNTVTGSSNSLVVGFDNTITSSLQSHIFGSDNKNTSSWYSTIVGRLNTVTGSTNSISIGNYNTLTNAANSVSLGVNNKITSPDSYAIGKNVRVDGTNSVAIGSGAFATDSNTIVIGSCEIETTKIESKNVLIDVKTNCSVNSQSKITLKADEIVLDGYTGNIEKYKFSMTIGRERTSSSKMIIKLFRARCDMYSGETISTILELTKPSAAFVGKYKIASGFTPSSNIVFGSGDTLTNIPTNIAFVMVNPRTLAWYFGDNSNKNEIVTKQIEGYRIIAISPEDNSNILDSSHVKYYGFNDLTRLKIYSNSDISKTNPGNLDEYVGYDQFSSKNYQTLTSDFDLELYSISYSNRADNTLTFYDRRSNTYQIITTEQHRYKYNAKIKNGVIVDHSEVRGSYFNGDWLPIPNWSPDWDYVMLNF